MRTLVPLRRSRYDAKHGILKCPGGKIHLLAAPDEARPLLLYARARDCSRRHERPTVVSAFVAPALPRTMKNDVITRLVGAILLGQNG